jgi:hypothetical protein
MACRDQIACRVSVSLVFLIHSLSFINIIIIIIIILLYIQFAIPIKYYEVGVLSKNVQPKNKIKYNNNNIIIQRSTL